MRIKVGFGYDVHRLVEGPDLILGGVNIPFEKGLDGHSDADVLIHAICDALLGAAGLRDIGYHFPDTDPQYKNADSKILLMDVMALLAKNNWSVGNVDCTICAEAPKINPHIPNMIDTLAPIINCDAADINIKATTNEKMGFVGLGDGMAAYAVALIQK